MEIGENTPLLLEEAARLAYPDGSVTAGMLYRLYRRGLLTVERPGKRLYTTLRAIEEMRQLCRQDAKGHISTTGKPTGTRTASAGAASGSSGTDRSNAAQAAALQIVRKLSEHCKTTSPANTKSRESATVIPIKS